jgi:hypothetical protein
MTKTICSFEEVLAYRNPRVLNKFRNLFAVTADEAERLFAETKKWLWLTAVRRESGQPSLVIHESMVILDELWHTFILHTQDYTDFCLRHFGFYVHHSPGYPDFVPRTEEETTEQLSYIWDTLGEETVLRWYDEYTEMYSPETLKSLVTIPEFGTPCRAL